MAQPTKPNPPRWEYHVATVNTFGPGNLNGAQVKASEFGRDGWELVSVVSVNAAETQLWFKRRLGA